MSVGLWAIFMAAVGCGSNEPEIPPDLLDAIARGEATGSGDYPPGPYGREVGDTVRSFTLEGWENPVAANFDLDRVEQLSTSDLYDPNSEGEARVLLINTSAVWCQPCQVEHSGLSQRYKQFRPRGLRIFSGLYQNSAQQPADLEDLRAWARAYESNYPLLVDPDFVLGALGTTTPPLNVVVDTADMTIIARFVGNQEAPLWEFIDQALSERGSDQ